MRLRIEELEWMVRVRSGVSWSMGDGQNKHSGQDSEAASKPTRVFLGTAEADGHNLGVVSALEQGGGNGGGGSPFSLDAALSPRSAPADAPGASVPVPIEKVDSTLDGITLKSTALPPDIVARVMTTPSPSLLQSDVSPSAPPPRRPSGERRSSLKLKLSDLKTPARNLTRDAGHTPMAVIADPDMGQASVGEGTPDQAPADTGSEVKSETAEPQRPRENSESYFPDAPDDDPALTGPLSLLNEEEHDQDFLKELNQKLLDSARQLVNTEPKGQPKEADAEPPSQGEPEPELKFKNTTNFGTAFGKSS